MIDLGLVQVTPREARECMRMMLHDARELAGQFHGENRSEKFRANWPDEYKFARANWKSFIQAVIRAYATLMGQPGVPDVDKHRMYVARLLWEHVSKDKAAEADNRLQLFPGTQQFVGDPFENRKINQQFGLAKNLRAHLMNSLVTRH
jgi:hypothetical protein